MKRHPTCPDCGQRLPDSYRCTRCDRPWRRGDEPLYPNNLAQDEAFLDALVRARDAAAELLAAHGGDDADGRCGCGLCDDVRGLDWVLRSAVSAVAAAVEPRNEERHFRDVAAAGRSGGGDEPLLVPAGEVTGR